MNEKQQDKDNLPVKKLLQGSVLILISNLIYIGNNYLVAWTGLKAPEIALVRGGLQVLVFGFVVWRKKETSGDENKHSGLNSNRLLLYTLVGLFGFTVSTASFAVLAAIPLMTIGDLIVISFTSPVFSVFLDRLVLKRALTFLSIGLCFFIVLGDVLVVQPSFIFGEEDSINNTANNSIKPLEGERNLDKHGKQYYLGVVLCLYTAAAGAVANVVSAQCIKMDVSTSHLMLVSGFSSLLLSLISTLFLSNRLITAPQSLSLQAAILLPVSAVITMIAYWTITLAVSITRHPTLISMLRSTEILISLGTESLWWRQLPGTISLLGSLLVAVCVLSMAAHDKIVTACKEAWKKFSGEKNEESDNIVTRL